MRHRARRYSACLCAAACAVTTGAAPAAAVTDGAHYRLAQQVPLPGDEGWDYLAFAPESHRLFISHGTAKIHLSHIFTKLHVTTRTGILKAISEHS